MPWGAGVRARGLARRGSTPRAPSRTRPGDRRLGCPHPEGAPRPRRQRLRGRSVPGVPCPPRGFRVAGDGTRGCRHPKGRRASRNVAKAVARPLPRQARETAGHHPVYPLRRLAFRALRPHSGIHSLESRCDSRTSVIHERKRGSRQSKAHRDSEIGTLLALAAIDP